MVADVDETALATLADQLPGAATTTDAAQAADELADTIVIDATNPLADDLSGLATDDSPAGAERVQAAAPNARVVKAFNTVFAGNQATAEVDGVQLDGFVAGDDADAMHVVADLLDTVGFRVIDVGGLSAARYLEGMAYLNIALNARNGLPWQSGWKLVGPVG